MNAREYLSRARYLETLVQSGLQQVEALKSLAERVTAVYEYEPVSHTRNTAAMQDIVIRIMKAEEDLNRKIDELVDAKTEIGLTIDQVPDITLRILLGKKYLEYHSLEQASLEMHYSYRRICGLHAIALQEVQKILDSKEALHPISS